MSRRDQPAHAPALAHRATLREHIRKLGHMHALTNCGARHQQISQMLLLGGLLPHKPPDMVTSPHDVITLVRDGPGSYTATGHFLHLLHLPSTNV